MPSWLWCANQYPALLCVLCCVVLCSTVFVVLCCIRICCVFCYAKLFSLSFVCVLNLFAAAVSVVFFFYDYCWGFFFFFCLIGFMFYGWICKWTAKWQICCVLFLLLFLLSSIIFSWQFVRLCMSYSSFIILFPFKVTLKEGSLFCIIFPL